MIDISIQCNRWNKKVNCKCSETVTIDILPIFIKAVVFHHVGLSWMILPKKHNKLSVEEQFIEWCTGGPWVNNIFLKPTWTHI